MTSLYELLPPMSPAERREVAARIIDSQNTVLSVDRFDTLNGITLEREEWHLWLGRRTGNLHTRRAWWKLYEHFCRDRDHSARQSADARDQHDTYADALR